MNVNDFIRAYYYFNTVIFYYVVLISVAFTLLALVAAFAMRKYKRRNSFVDYTALLSSDETPGISIIAPAYNEEKTIVENVRSLLNLHYPEYEIVIVNDGSKDHTLSLLIEAYSLYRVKFLVNAQLETKICRGVYKSSNPAYAKLTIVDKENGGKADALNLGINIAKHKYIACIDVDCILEYDALLKLVKPFLEGSKKVIATGGVVRIANSCEVKAGHITKVNLPKSFIARFQVLEYLRAFLMGRIAWGKINGLLLISGAFGMFDKEIVIEAGGYDTKTVGEDMELVVRMRRYMHDKKINYTVAFIPDPLCWTEVPESWKILQRQRNRWARGTFETLWIHRKLILNPKYKTMGLVSLPFWILFEWLAPLIELTGILLFALMVFLDLANWTYFFSFLILVYCFSVMFTLYAIWFEEHAYQQYKNPKNILILLGTCLIEPFFYHPLVMFAAFKGNVDKLLGKNSWGEMQRTGFKSKQGGN